MWSKSQGQLPYGLAAVPLNGLKPAAKKVNSSSPLLVPASCRFLILHCSRFSTLGFLLLPVVSQDWKRPQHWHSEGMRLRSGQRHPTGCRSPQQPLGWSSVPKVPPAQGPSSTQRRSGSSEGNPSPCSRLEKKARRSLSRRTPCTRKLQPGRLHQTSCWRMGLQGRLSA